MLETQRKAYPQKFDNLVRGITRGYIKDGVVDTSIHLDGILVMVQFSQIGKVEFTVPWGYLSDELLPGWIHNQLSNAVHDLVAHKYLNDL